MEQVLNELVASLDAHLARIDAASDELLTTGMAAVALAPEDDALPSEHRVQHLGAIGEHLHRAVSKMTLLHNSVLTGDTRPSSATAPMRAVADEVRQHCDKIAHLALGARPWLDGIAYTRAVQSACRATLESARDLSQTLSGSAPAASRTDRTPSFLDASQGTRSQRALQSTGVAWDAADYLKALPATNGAAVARTLDGHAAMMQDALDELAEALDAARDGGNKAQEDEDEEDEENGTQEDQFDDFGGFAGTSVLAADVATLSAARALVNVCQLLVRKASVRAAPLAATDAAGHAWADALALIGDATAAHADDLAVAIDQGDTADALTAAAALESDATQMAETAASRTPEEHKAWFEKAAAKAVEEAQRVVAAVRAVGGSGGAAPNR